MHHFLAKGIAVALALPAPQVPAQIYPTKPVRVIITFPPGSATDIVGRKLTKYARYQSGGHPAQVSGTA